MLDQLKSKWAMMKPKHKTLTIWGGGFLVMAVLVMLFSNQPIKKAVKVEVESN